MWSRAAWPELTQLITPRFLAMPAPPTHMASSNRGMALGRCDPTVVTKARLIRERDPESAAGAFGAAAADPEAGLKKNLLSGRLAHRMLDPIGAVVPAAAALARRASAGRRSYSARWLRRGL